MIEKSHFNILLFRFNTCNSLLPLVLMINEPGTNTLIVIIPVIVCTTELGGVPYKYNTLLLTLLVCSYVPVLLYTRVDVLRWSGHYPHCSHCYILPCVYDLTRTPCQLL